MRSLTAAAGILFCALISSNAHADCVLKTEDARDLSREAIDALQEFYQRHCSDADTPLIFYRDSTLGASYTPPKGGYSAHKREYYPDIAKRQHHEGATTAAYILEADGTVKQATIIESSGYKELDKATLEAVMDARYASPAKFNGMAARVLVYLKLTWHLTH